MSKQRAQYGIIGDPVEHSLSPLMHNTVFKALHVPAEYKLFPLKENEVDGFFDELKQKENTILGLNVTVPYKETVLKYLDSLTPFAQRIGSVNTIVITFERKLIGYNTDAPGFMAHLMELGFKTTGKRIAILGSGGSCRAILATLCLIPERPQTIKIYNRTRERIKTLLTDMRERIDMSIVEPVKSIDDLELELADMLINTTSVGLHKDDPCLVSEDLIHSNMLVYDLIYNPPETVLLKMSKSKGAKTSNGLGMLFYQGVLAIQHWINVQLDEDIKRKMRKSLEQGACYDGG
jgi:shikimate dehydrogenase